MWAMQAAAAVTVLSTVVLASCGNSGSGGATEEPVATGSPDAPADTAAARVRACTIFAVEEVEALVGSPVTAGPTPSDAGAGCEWTAEVIDEETGSRSSHLVELLVRDPGTALDQALTIEGAPTPVTGLGDEALVETSTASFPAVMAGYRDADRVVTLLYQVQSEGTVDTDPRTRKDAVVEVLRSLQETIAASA